MALPETYYAHMDENGNLPDQHEWYQDLEASKSDMVDCAEDYNDDRILYEIMIRPIYKTVRDVRLEKI